MAWFDNFFNVDYLDTYTYLDAGRTSAEVDRIAELLDLRPEHAVLDVPCGFGRHCLELSRRGFHVTGLEYNGVQIDRARQMMDESGVFFEIVQGDMRQIPFENRFDRLFNYFTSFGYFCDEENKKTADGFFRALKPGGIMLLETINRDFTIGYGFQRFSVERHQNDLILTEERKFDILTSRMYSMHTLIKSGGVISERELDIRLYSAHEIIRLLENTGFKILKTVDENMAPVGLSSKRLNITAQKP